MCSSTTRPDFRELRTRGDGRGHGECLAGFDLVGVPFWQAPPKPESCGGGSLSPAEVQQLLGMSGESVRHGKQTAYPAFYFDLTGGRVWPELQTVLPLLDSVQAHPQGVPVWTSAGPLRGACSIAGAASPGSPHFVSCSF